MIQRFNHQFWSHSMSWDLHRAPRSPRGCSSTVTMISSSFFNTVCTGGCSPGLRGRVWPPHFTDFTCSPTSPSKSCVHPRNWSETFEAPASSDVQDFVFQEKRGSRQDPAPRKDTTKVFPSRRHSSAPRAHPQVQHSPALVLTHHFPSADASLRAHLLPGGS